MDTQRIYERIVMNDYFKKMKCLRNQWKDSTDRKFARIPSLVDIGGEDYAQYDPIIKTGHALVIDMINAVIQALLEEYNIPVTYYDLSKGVSDAYFFDGEKEVQVEHSQVRQKKRILAFSRNDENTDLLYIFKEFGIEKRVPKNILAALSQSAKLNMYCYISYVENEAFSEVLNHNDNEKDPTRGTGIYSLKQFFIDFFGQNEYNVFKSYTKKFEASVNEYFGFVLLRTLKPNAILNFKKQCWNELQKINASRISELNRLSDSQRTIIEKHFFNERNCDIVLGKSDFAQSYMTAEWLYLSLPNAGKIDLTAIAMGYFKSIEQLLFCFVSLHTFEKDGYPRKIYVNGIGLDDVTDALIKDEEKTKLITLGGLTGFFGQYYSDTGRHIPRNQDLLASGINSQTHDFIIETLNSITPLRNGYFHKDNLENSDVVNKARTTAQLIFYLILGAYTLSENDKEELKIIRRNKQNDFYKLCSYINNKYYDSKMLEIPIIYKYKDSDPYEFVLPYYDDSIEYDEYGEAVFSGLYFKQFGKNGKVFKLTQETVPAELWEGTLVISESIPISIQPSGPQLQLFKNGAFLASVK